jgi:hypothetical protein
MTLSGRIITELPLCRLWTDEGELTAVREEDLNRHAIRELMKQAAVLFVVADVGKMLEWIDAEKCFAFWKEEIAEHVVDNPNEIYLDHFPGNYAYIASRWKHNGSFPIILLEKCH